MPTASPRRYGWSAKLSNRKLYDITVRRADKLHSGIPIIELMETVRILPNLCQWALIRQEWNFNEVTCWIFDSTWLNLAKIASWRSWAFQLTVLDQVATRWHEVWRRRNIMQRIYGILCKGIGRDRPESKRGILDLLYTFLECLGEWCRRGLELSLKGRFFISGLRLEGLARAW